MSKRTLYAIVSAWNSINMCFLAEPGGGRVNGRFDWVLANAKFADFDNDHILMFSTVKEAEQHAQQLGISMCKIVPIGRSDEK